MTESIGQQLKQAREARGLTIQKAAQVTRIRPHLLEAIEADDFESLPSPAQARGFLRLYADYLGLSFGEMIERQRGEAAETGKIAATTAGSAPPPSSEATPEETAPAIEPEEAALEEAAPGTTMPEVAGGEPTQPSQPSQFIFYSIGMQLRQRREMLGLSFDEIERNTHVRRHYLQALEAGRFDSLPSPVQARGMLANYARFLDIDVDALLLRFADALQSQRLEKQPKPVEKPERQKPGPKIPPSIRLFVSGDLVFGGSLIILLIAFTIWGINRIVAWRAAPATEATAPSISDILLTPAAETAFAVESPPGATFTLLPPTLSMTPFSAIPVSHGGSVQIYVIVLERTWMRITVDGQIEFEGRALAGNAYPFEGNKQVEVLTGNGAGLQIIYNQSDLGTLGGRDEIVDRIYSANAILLPTPTFTPTITTTPRVTPTPTITLTPTPNRTPTRSLP